MSDSQNTVHYSIFPVNPEAHLFEVCCTISQPSMDGQRVSLPAWIPGSYMIRDFARHIVKMQAESDGQPVVIHKHDKQTWRCEPCQGELVLTYQVYAWDLSVRAAHLDTTHGYFNGTCVFLAVDGKELLPHTVEILPPHGEAFKGWRVATTLGSIEAPAYGFGLYQATSYDELVDHPVEMGEFSLATFTACGVSHDIVITGRCQADMDRLCRDLEKICAQHIRFFGEPAPVSRYLFQVMVVGEGYGGLEHRSSTSLLCSRDDLPRQGEERTDEQYRNFLGLCSHEYFHTWNVKRIKPAVFIPYDFSREVHTELLWLFEGVTSYYDDLGLVRSGLISVEDYLEMLAQTVTRVLRGKGRLSQSVAESSFDAWTKFYKQDENAPNAIVSYYSKGATIALALDLTLRQRSAERYSLDDVMRHLWMEYGQKGQGVAEDEVALIIRQLTGVDIDDFLQRAVHGTGDLPLAELLRTVAIDMRLRAASGQDDKGGPTSAEGLRTVLGVRCKEHPQGAEISHAFADAAAQRAGLSAGDVVIALEGLKVSASTLEKQVNRFAPESMVTIHAFRRDELMEFSVRLDTAPTDTCELKLMMEPDQIALARRQNWLTGC